MKKYLAYSVLRLVFEIYHVVKWSVKSISKDTIIVFLLLGIMTFSLKGLHYIAKKQNQNYIEIMNYRVDEQRIYTSATVWEAEDVASSFLLDQYVWRSGEDEIKRFRGDVDSIFFSAPSIEIVLASLSMSDKKKEEELLRKLYLRNNYDVSDYTDTWYFPRILEKIRQGDFYAAHSLMNRYYELNDLFCEWVPLQYYNNYKYLIRLLLQERWMLTCNRKTAEDLFELIKTEQWNSSSFSHIYEDLHQRLALQDYMDYLVGLNYIHDKDYIAAYEHFYNLYQRCSEKIMKEYCSFMAIRSAFWIFDKERTQENRNFFFRVYNDLSKSVNISYFQPDIEYYHNLVEKLPIKL